MLHADLYGQLSHIPHRDLLPISHSHMRLCMRAVASGEALTQQTSNGDKIRAKSIQGPELQQLVGEHNFPAGDRDVPVDPHVDAVALLILGSAFLIIRPDNALPQLDQLAGCGKGLAVHDQQILQAGQQYVGLWTSLSGGARLSLQQRQDWPCAYSAHDEPAQTTFVVTTSGPELEHVQQQISTTVSVCTLVHQYAVCC